LIATPGQDATVGFATAPNVAAKDDTWNNLIISQILDQYSIAAKVTAESLPLGVSQPSIQPIGEVEQSMLQSPTTGMSRQVWPTLPTIRPVEVRPEMFVVLGKWQGTVTEVHGDEFSAVIEDMLDGHAPEQGTFSVDELSRDDRDLLREGSSFYWYVGYREPLGGRRTSTSEIRMRRVPHWSDATNVVTPWALRFAAHAASSQSGDPTAPIPAGTWFRNMRNLVGKLWPSSQRQPPTK
jgi:hypothetical protein